MIKGLGVGRDGEEKEVVELALHEAGPGTDYDAMLEEIFKADSVQVW